MSIANIVNRVRQLVLAILLSIFAVTSWGDVVLQYHHISESSPKATSTSPDLFRQHMDYLKTEGFEVVPLTEMIEDLRQNPERAKRSRRVAITFDDGYDSVYQVAYPLLKQKNWPFTIFVNTAPLDDQWKGFSSWQQLREMAANGAVIANHSHSHSHFSRRPEGLEESEWLQRVRSDVEQAQRRIQEEIGTAPKLLAYPYGEFDSAIEALIQDMGYIAFGQHSGPLSPLAVSSAESTTLSLQALPRFPFGGYYGTDMDDFSAKVSSLPLLVQRVELKSGWFHQASTLPLLAASETQPVLLLTLTEAIAGLQCFATGQGALQVTPSAASNDLAEYAKYKVTLNQPLTPGRNRINCTAPGPDGRFYWFSQPFFLPRPDGSWPQE